MLFVFVTQPLARANCDALAAALGDIGGEVRHDPVDAVHVHLAWRRTPNRNKATRAIKFAETKGRRVEGWTIWEM